MAGEARDAPGLRARHGPAAPGATRPGSAQANSWPWIAVPALVVALVFAGLVWGFTSRTPTPPCPDGWSEHPEARCVRNEEACNAWLDGFANERLSCTAESKDGKAHLRVDLSGSGQVRVRVLDGGDRVVHDATYPFSHATVVNLEGTKGTWTLEVTYMQAGGAARIVLWG